MVRPAIPVAVNWEALDIENVGIPAVILSAKVPVDDNWIEGIDRNKFWL